MWHNICVDCGERLVIEEKTNKAGDTVIRKMCPECRNADPWQPRMH